MQNLLMPVRGRAGALVVLVCAAFVTLVARHAVHAQSLPVEPIVVQPAGPLMTAERVQQYLDASAQHLNYLPGEVLVKFRQGVTVAGQQRALLTLRSRPSTSALRWAGTVAILRDATEPNAHVLADQLRTQPEVELAEPNYLRHKSSVPNDPSFSTRQWNFTELDMARAWDINPGATANLIVAVVDTGITTVNQTMAFKIWNGTAITTQNFVFKTNPDFTTTRFISPMDFTGSLGTTVLDTDGHGTHVSSTIGEDTNNSIAEAGIAYKVRIMPVKVCTSYWDVQFAMSAVGFPGYAPSDAGGCSDEAISAGIQYAADNGAKLINVSLGGEGGSTIVQSAINYAIGKGAFIAAAAGNEFETGNPVEYPAGYGPSIDGLMSVGAVGKSLVRAYYSNTGSTLEIVAPGGDDRDSDAAGSGYIWQATISQTDSDPFFARLPGFVPRFDRYVEAGFEGTSMATPHVVGIAALIMSQGVTSPAAIEALIRATALHKGTSAAGKADTEYGYGLIQPRTALRGFSVSK